MVNYSSHSIKVLKGLDGVKKRPGMYIGDTGDGTGLHRLIFEVVDNSMDEALVGHCDIIYVSIDNNNNVTVKDNGRGIPIDFHFSEEKTSLEVILTSLHSGGKFDNNVYKISSGLHGVGVSVVNALSEYMHACIFRDGYVYRQNYYNGYVYTELLKVGKKSYKGTLIKFKPSFVYFNNIFFSYSILDQRFRELSFLNSGIKIILNYKKKQKEKIYFFSGGIKAFVEKLNFKRSNINNVLFFKGIKNEIFVECALQWTNIYNENIFCYTNNVRQKDGGSHMSGFKTALTKTFNMYMENYLFFKKNKPNIIGDDIREGLVSVLSVKLSDPKFSSQTKEKLVSLNVKFVVEAIISKNLYSYLLENPVVSKIICNKIFDSFKAREAAKKARDIVRKKEFLEFNKISSRLAGCQLKDPAFLELFLVEGDSAGGSAKQARSRINQAILPLKGKILNVEKASMDKLLSSVEIGLLISVLGCGIGEMDYNFFNLKYHTIIIMTDADVDGLHIRTLLLTFFYRYMKDLILRGCIYIAQPPLYRLKKGKNILYFNDINDLNNYFFDNILFEIKIFSMKKTVILFHEDLEFVCHIYKKISLIIDNLSAKYPKELLEVFFNVFKLSNENFFEIDILNNWKNLAQFYFDKYYFNKDIYFFINYIQDQGIKISLCKYSVFYDYFFPLEFFLSKEYNDLFNLGSSIKYLIDDDFYVQRDKKCYKIINFIKTMEWIKNESKIGFILQRYKGLGEMNPEQLWETTMNPKNRRIIKINLEKEDDVNSVFSMLMGDNIEGRKKFIDKNALYAKNIDF